MRKSVFMRKIISILLVCTTALLFSFSLCACSSDDAFSPPAVNGEFTAQAQIEYNSLAISADISVLKENVVTISVTSPETLKGLTYRFTDSTLKMGYNGLESTSDEAFVPVDGFANCLYRVLQSINKSEYDFDCNQDEMSRFTGNLGGAQYTFTVDNQSGNIRGITVSKPQMTVNFVNVSEQ